MNKWKAIQYFYMGILQSVKMAILSKFIQIFKEISMKIPT